MTELSKEQAFGAWFNAARPGDRYVYHRGYLARDRRDRDATRRIADEAWLLGDLGRVHLVQERHGDLDYSYIAVKASPDQLRHAA